MTSGQSALEEGSLGRTRVREDWQLSEYWSVHGENFLSVPIGSYVLVLEVNDKYIHFFWRGTIFVAPASWAPDEPGNLTWLEVL